MMKNVIKELLGITKQAELLKEIKIERRKHNAFVLAWKFLFFHTTRCMSHNLIT